MSRISYSSGYDLCRRISPVKKATKAQASLVDADTHVESFRQTRHNRRTELVEDYVELIADLIADRGEARQVDIAQRLGVAQPTVAKKLKRLANEGLIQQCPYRGVFLTEAGVNLAGKSRERHQKRRHNGRSLKQDSLQASIHALLDERFSAKDDYAPGAFDARMSTFSI